MLRAGIARVVVALEDPDPRVAGGGIAQLRQAGIEVITGVLRQKAAEQNRAFLHRVRTGHPFGILKWAMGLDGRTALTNGASQWISGSPARNWVHKLRAGCDAVIVGGGTVCADDPLLTSPDRQATDAAAQRHRGLADHAQNWMDKMSSTLTLISVGAVNAMRPSCRHLSQCSRRQSFPDHCLLPVKITIHPGGFAIIGFMAEVHKALDLVKLTEKDVKHIARNQPFRIDVRKRFLHIHEGNRERLARIDWHLPTLKKSLNIIL